MVLEWRKREHGDVEEAFLGWPHGSTSITGMWLIQVLVSWQLEGKAKTTPVAGRLLGSRV